MKKVSSKNIIFKLKKFSKNIFSIKYIWYLILFVLVGLSASVIAFDVYVFITFAVSWQDEISEIKLDITNLDDTLMSDALSNIEDRYLRFTEAEEKLTDISNPF